MSGHQFQDRLFVPLMGLFIVIILILFAEHVRYGDFDGETDIVSANGTSKGASCSLPPLASPSLYSLAPCLLRRLL